MAKNKTGAMAGCDLSYQISPKFDKRILLYMQWTRVWRVQYTVLWVSIADSRNVPKMLHESCACGITAESVARSVCHARTETISTRGLISTDVRRLTMGIRRSEKCIVRRFRRRAGAIELT